MNHPSIPHRDRHGLRSLRYTAGVLRRGQRRQLVATAPGPIHCDEPTCVAGWRRGPHGGDVPCECGNLDRLARKVNAARLPPWSADALRLSWAGDALDPSVWPTEWPSVRPGVLICGPCGTGKSVFAAALVGRALDPSTPGEREESDGIKGALWVSWVHLLDDIKATFSDDERRSRLLQRIEGASLLIVDDLGAGRPTDWTRETAELILARRLDEGRPIVVTTNRNPDTEDMSEAVGPRVASRLRRLGKPLRMVSQDLRRTNRPTPALPEYVREDSRPPAVSNEQRAERLAKLRSGIEALGGSMAMGAPR